jgi:hypothetical protein
MNTDRSLRIGAVLYLCLTVFICGEEAVGAAPAPPRVAVEAGWNGRARAGAWAPVRVTISGLAEPVEGTLEIEIDDGSAARVARAGLAPERVALPRTATPVTLVPGGAKRFTLYVIPASVMVSAALPLSVTARVRARGRVIASGKGRLSLVSIGNRLLVAATGEPAGLQGWDGRPRQALGWAEPETPEDPNFAEPVVRIAHATPENLPERWNGYDAADLVVIAGPAWLRMSERQRRAVRRWVEGGGRAILCGEQASDWSDPEGRLLVPGTLRDITIPGGSAFRGGGGETVRLAKPAVGSRPSPPWPPSPKNGSGGNAHGSAFSPSPVLGRGGQGVRASSPRPSRSHEIAAAAIRPGAQATVFLRSGSAVLGCVAPAGFGAVLWLGIDPFRDGARRGGSLWPLLVGQVTGAAVAPPRMGRLADNPTASGLANTLPRLPAPSRGLLGAIAAIYILIFGPLNIRMLRILSRGPSAWLFLPALAVLMTGVLLAIGRSWGQSRALLNRVSVVEVMSGASTGRERGLSGLFSPTNAVYTVEAGEPAMLLEVADRTAIASGYSGPPGGVGLGGPYGGYGVTTPSDPARPDLRTGTLPTLQLEESSRWDGLPLALWTLQTQSYERLVDLGGRVTLSLSRRPGERPVGSVANGTSHRLARAYLHFEGYRLSLGDLEPGATRTVTAAGWVRRRLADRRASGFPGAAGGPVARETGTVAARDTLYEEAIVLLRPEGRGAEALLVAESHGLVLPVTVSGVTVAPRGALILVRARVGRGHLGIVR